MTRGDAATSGGKGGGAAAAAGAWRITAAGLDAVVLLLFLAKFGVISKRGSPSPVPGAADAFGWYLYSVESAVCLTVRMDRSSGE